MKWTPCVNKVLIIITLNRSYFVLGLTHWLFVGFFRAVCHSRRRRVQRYTEICDARIVPGKFKNRYATRTCICEKLDSHFVFS